MTSHRRLLLASATAFVLAAGISPAMADTSTDPATDPSIPTSTATEDDPMWLAEPGVTTTKQVADVIGSTALRNAGYDGTGVGVALIDTGVVPVPGLSSGNVVNGPDLSFEGQDPANRYLDTYGHGTHMAGIIAGNRAASQGVAAWSGIAPKAQLTSLKTGTSQGAVDVSQVIAAIDWVVEHRNDDPSHPIRVLNLSYGTGGVQNYQLDPITHAVENAWRAGIVVVAAGGNSGTERPRLNNPAYDPYVLAVGATDIAGTKTTSDDSIPAYSSRGDDARRVDIVAPGRSIASLRNPGSSADSENPSAVVGTEYFKGSGSSQAAAVTSGAVALLLQARPDLTPDQVKALLRSTATPLPQADPTGRGMGELNISKALATAVPANSTQTWPASTGLGSLEESRGGDHVVLDDQELTGERTILGDFDAASWAAASANYSAWSQGTWAGQELTGDGWSSDGSWTGKSWTGKSWTGKSWTGKSWTDAAWTGKSWTGKSWTGKSWTSDSWTDGS